MQHIKYAEHVNAPSHVLSWVHKNIKDETPTEEAEHVIDYLVSEDAPTRLESANYADTKKASEKWLKTQIKKGNGIKEAKTDTEIILDFNDGFKVVKLIGENAYKREGFLMSHCVASYFGKNVEVYSLRDKDNMPHCTMEKDQQIKGKGNGDIAPKYIDYVVQFLSHIGMTVGDSEMKHLGYINIEKLLPNLHVSVSDILYKGKYFQENKGFAELKDKNGDQYLGMDVLDYFPLLKEEKTDTSFRLKLNFDMSLMVEYHRKTMTILKKLFPKKGDDIQEGGHSAKMSGGDSAKMSGGRYAQMSGGHYAQMSGGHYAQIISGAESTLETKEHSILVGDHECKAKGGLGTLLVLTNRKMENGKYIIIDFKAGLVDGTTIKENTWYKLEHGEFIETSV